MIAILADPGSELLLQGNQAIARGALEAGIAWAGGYPGNPSSEILENLAQVRSKGKLYVEWSVNEKVALEGAAAASLSGLRALVTMKQNGVNVCLDTLTTLGQSGIEAGLVVVVADDPSGISSSNEEDSRFSAMLAYLPLFEPTTPQEALEMTRFAFDLSERIGQVCMVRSLSRVSHTRGNVTVGEMPEKPKKPRFNKKAQYHSFPVIGKHQAMYEKLELAQNICRKSLFNGYEGPDSPELMVFASGPSALYVREALEMTELDARAGLYKIGTTYPLPKDEVKSHMAMAGRILVVEEIDPVLEKNLKALYADEVTDLGVKEFFGKISGHVPAVGELTPNIVANALSRVMGQEVPAVNDYSKRSGEVIGDMAQPREFGFCPGCPHRASYWAMKNVLAADDRQGFVSGDIGCYTMGIWPTGFGQVRSVHCMGSGVGMSSGFGKLGEFGFDQPVISVVGDSTFFHAAIPALVNAAYNESGFLLVVMDNSATAMTGFQPHPGTGYSPTGEEIGQIAIEDVCASLGVEVQIVDPYDLKATEKALADGLKNLKKVKVIILRRNCALVQGRQGGFPYKMRVDQNVCRGEECGCNRYCNRVFRCPGLIWDEKAGRAKVDEVICVGCGVCEQICPAGAIVKEDAA